MALHDSKGIIAELLFYRKTVCCLLVLMTASTLLALISLARIGVLLDEINKLESANLSFPQEMTSSVSSIINSSFSQLGDQRSLINAHLFKYQEVLSRISQEQQITTETLKNETFSVINNFNALLKIQMEQLGNQTEQLKNRTVKLKSQVNNRTKLSVNQAKQVEQFFVSVSPFMVIPAFSCATLPPSSPSGYYWVRSSSGSLVNVYCDMTRSCGKITGGWMRVAELNTTCHQCPSGFMEQKDSNIRTCVRTAAPGGCSAVQYSTSQIQYSRVCGKVIAYSTGSVNAFDHYNPSINSYVDGVSLTHGDAREHIWTFAAADIRDARSSCKCIRSDAPSPPSFVGMDYFCDSAERPERLWDGVGCMPPNDCCAFNTPPWFYRELPRPTTDAIDMRVCRNKPSSNEDLQIEVIELFVQ